MVRRIEQVNDLIREELGVIIDREVEALEQVLVTITRVMTSPDLHYADVLLAVTPYTAEQQALGNFAKQIGSIQRRLNQRLRMRPVPRIRFVIDKEQKRAERIEELLARPASGGGASGQLKNGEE